MPDPTDGLSVIDRIAADRYGAKDRLPSDAAYKSEQEVHLQELRAEHELLIAAIRKNRDGARSIALGHIAPELARLFRATADLAELTQQEDLHEADETRVYGLLLSIAASSRDARDLWAVLFRETGQGPSEGDI